MPLSCAALRHVEVVPLPARSQLWSHVRPGDFIDGYAVTSPLPLDRALETALAMPGWAQHLLALRNLLMRPFGLRSAAYEKIHSVPYLIHQHNRLPVYGVHHLQRASEGFLLIES